MINSKGRKVENFDTNAKTNVVEKKPIKGKTK